MKKYVLVLILMSIALPAIAGGVGYIDYEKIFANYKFAQNTAKDIQAKEIEIAKFMELRENEYNKLETPVQKQKFEEKVKAELQSKEKFFNTYKNKKEEEVYTRIHAVTEKIRLEKGFDAVFDSRSIFSGGTNITDAVLTKLNENTK